MDQSLSMKKFILSNILIGSFVFFSNSEAKSQDVFTFIDSIIVLNKSTAFENVHWYGEIVNVADTAEVDMKWVLTTPNGVPTAWDCNFDDQTTNTFSVAEGDSSQFVLKYDLDFFQKLIIGVKHNQKIGTGLYDFKISTLDQPDKIKSLKFRVTFYDEQTGIEELAFEENMLLYHDGRFIANQNLRNILVYDLGGRLLYQQDKLLTQESFSVQKHYMLVASFEYQGKTYSRKYLTGY